jgi:orotate phosphoribosyltransferase
MKEGSAISSANDRSGTASNSLNLFDTNRVRLTEAEALNELRDDLHRASYRPGDVRLDSGVEQPYFFDKYLIVSRPSILRRLSRFLAARVPASTDRVAAPTLGALAIGTAVSLETGLPLAVVRTQWDDSHRGRPVEGGLHQGETVAVIEDIVVTGSRALQAVERLREAGAQVTAVLAAVDCERGADLRLESAGVAYQPLFRYSAFSRSRETS